MALESPNMTFLRNRQPGKKMSWLTDDSIELKMAHGHGCFSSWTKLKLVLQPATIDGETQPCLFIGTVEGEVGGLPHICHMHHKWRRCQIS